MSPATLYTLTDDRDLAVDVGPCHVHRLRAYCGMPLPRHAYSGVWWCYPGNALGKLLLLNLLNIYDFI
jgi:hypothetical protein